MNRTTLTSAQRSAFFRALQAASVELGHTTAGEREAYRKTVMREETGKEHLAQLSRTADFDACMCRFAADAGDYETASRFAVADAARRAALVRICCAQVMQLKGCALGTTEAADYLAGIVEQASATRRSGWTAPPTACRRSSRSLTRTGGGSFAGCATDARRGDSWPLTQRSCTSRCRLAASGSATTPAPTTP